MKFLCCCLLSLLAIVSGAFASANEFELGNRAFEEGRYVEARGHYQAAIDQGQTTANVFYNLGNSDAQVGATGLAMLNYERALALDPHHESARTNLKFLRDQTVSKTPERSPWMVALDALSLKAWVIVASIAGWLFVFLLIIPLSRGRRLSPTGIFLMIVALFATACAGAGIWFARRELDAALVIAKQVEARRAPADRADLADVLPIGTRIRWLNERSGWVECELPDGTRAWVPQGTIERIRITST